MRKIAITKINATTPVLPGSIEVSGDFTKLFQGKFYRNPSTSDVLPPYTTPAPSGYNLIQATTFDLVENDKYSGRYTVYSPVSASGTPPAVYSAGRTIISVNEPISALVSGESNTLATTGYITNISTYLLDTGTSTITIPPTVDITAYPLEFLGRDSAGWGEVFSQNFVKLATNFANANAPANPFVGQNWYDTDDRQVRVWDGTTWELLNRASYGVTYQHTQSTSSKIWTINHGLGLPAPYISLCQFFVDRGQGPQIIIPSNVEFLSPTQMRVTFSNPEVGYVLVRK